MTMKQREAAVEKVTGPQEHKHRPSYISHFSKVLSHLSIDSRENIPSFPNSAFSLVYSAPYIMSAYSVCCLCSCSEGEIRPGVCAAPLSRSSCWWRWLGLRVPALSSGAAPCGLCLYRRGSLCFRVVTQLQTLLPEVM